MIDEEVYVLGTDETMRSTVCSMVELSAGVSQVLLGALRYPHSACLICQLLQLILAESG